MGPIGIPELIIIVAVLVVGGLVLVWPAARICNRIGCPPWLAALILVPVANVMLLWFVAFSPWPKRGDNGA